MRVRGKKARWRLEREREGGRGGNIRGGNVAIDGENRDVVTLEVEDDDMT